MRWLRSILWTGERNTIGIDAAGRQPPHRSGGKSPPPTLPDHSSAGSDGSFIIESPTQSALETKIDEKFGAWCENCRQDYKINATIKYRDTMAYSESKISAALNLNYKSAAADLGIDFKAISEGKKSVMTCEYEQIFYTVKCDKPEYPAQFFADSVTWQDLQSKGVSASAPPAYVQAVSYGLLSSWKPALPVWR